MYETSDDENIEVYRRPTSYTDPVTRKIHQTFVPYDGNFRYDNVDNNAYYYQHDKRDEVKNMK